MKKYRICISCALPIQKSARADIYLCRNCEQEHHKADLLFPVYHQRWQ